MTKKLPGLARMASVIALLIAFGLNFSGVALAQKNELSLSEFARIIPKAETHVHFSAIVYPDVALKLAKKNGVKLSFSSPAELAADRTWTLSPWRGSSAELWDGYFQRLAEFQSVIRTADDVREVVVEWIKRSAVASNTRYAELHIPYPNSSTKLKLDADSYFHGLALARQQIKRDYDIELRFTGSIYVFHPSAVPEALKEVKRYSHYNGDSSIVGLAVFTTLPEVEVVAPVYDLARSLGFKTPMHLGTRAPSTDAAETVKPIWDAIQKLNIDRIDHGYLSILDDKLVTLIADKKVPMTNCPHVFTSGKFTFPEDDVNQTWSWDNFPFRHFYDRGVITSLHTDTPAMGSTYSLADIYEDVARHYGFKKKDVIAWARNSFKSALIPEAQIKSYLEELDAWVQTYR